MYVLPKDLPGTLGPVKGCARPSIDEAAHIEERGRKMETSVRTLESIDGRSVVYSRIEKVASNASVSYRTTLDGFHTWDSQSLAAHDEDNLHRSETA